ncbi:MAG: amidase [Actinomycetales bacterium]
MSDVHQLTALEQARAIASGEITSTALTEHYLARTERLSDAVGAFVTVCADLALDQARAADEQVRRARQQGVLGELSPLHGVIVPIKDLNLLAGVRCRFGSATTDLIAPHDDHVVTRLKQAGAVMTGKTNTPEFGLPCYTEPDVAPPARTPWDRQRSAGGSSGGAAAAVAAGLASAAQGSDGGGSIRIPASACGLVGIKPARGRISAGPLAEAIGELGTSGPLARTVADAAALLDAMSGPFPGDTMVAPPLPTGQTFLQASQCEPGRLRIGRFCAPVITDTPVHPDCLAAYEDASTLLADLGHEVQDVTPPVTTELVPWFMAIWATIALMMPVAAEDQARLRPLTRWLREHGAQVRGIELAQAALQLRVLSRRAVSFLHGHDVLLTPTLAQPPALIGALRQDDDPAADFEAQKAFTPFTAFFNMTGQPAISLPLHWTEQGLPIGVQLVGRPFDEATIISLAAQLEQARPWAARYPGCWSALDSANSHSPNSHSSNSHSSNSHSTENGGSR